MKHIALKITAFIFGIALWLYVMSLNTFKVTMEVPVRLVRLPELLAIASKPPHSMDITLEGAPFDLMRLKSKLNSNDTTVAAIIVDLQDAELGSMRMHITDKNFSAPSRTSASSSPTASCCSSTSISTPESCATSPSIPGLPSTPPRATCSQTGPR